MANLWQFQIVIKEKVGELEISLRKNQWDEENRLLGVDLKPDQAAAHPIAVYTYSAGGERTIRYNMDRADANSNARRVGASSRDNIMLYPSGLLMGKVKHVDSKGTLLHRMTYTKHYYYIGSERISAKTGTMTDLGLYPATLLQGAGALPQLNTTTIRNNSTAVVTKAKSLVTKTYSYFGQQPPVITPRVEEEQINYTHDSNKLNLFYFHPDHLGSSSYITNKNGVVSQHMEYLPFGETLVDEHINSFNSPFKFNGKEYDEETGNYYYSARYYDPKLSIFMSVDPMAEKYPGISPFVYCLNNPLNIIDPDGRDIIYLNDSHAVSGLGHAAVLIGNDTDGWRYVSMNGTGKGSAAWGNSQNADLGDALAKLEDGVWRGNDFRGTNLTLEEVIEIVNTSNPEETHDYNRAIRITTSPEEDIAAYEAACEQANSPKYSIFYSSCIDVPQAAYSAVKSKKTRRNNFVNRQVNNVNTGAYMLIPNLWFTYLSIKSPFIKDMEVFKFKDSSEDNMVHRSPRYF